MGEKAHESKKREKSTPACVPKGIELTIAAYFPLPVEWKAPGQEAKAYDAGHWSPTVEDFRILGEAPNRRVLRGAVAVETPPTTKLYPHGLLNLGQFRQILEAHYDENMNRFERAKHSIRRLNLITHGRPGMISLQGKVSPNGEVNLSRGVSPTEPSQVNEDTDVINEAVIQWMNAKDSKYGRKYREAIKAMFTHPECEKPEIWLICCKGGGGKSHNADGSAFAVGAGSVLAKQLANTLQIRVMAYTENVWVWPESRGGVLVDRDITSIGEHGTRGLGYYTATDLYLDKEKQRRFGLHMKDAVPFEPMPGAEPFADMELGLEP